MKRYLIIALFVLLVMSIVFYLQRNWVTAHEDLTAGIMTSVVLILALIPALNTLAAMRHERFTSIAMRIRDTYDSGQVLEARIAVQAILNEQEKQGIMSKNKKGQDFLRIIKNYKKNNPSEFLKLISIPALYDNIGWLVKEHCCEAKTIDELLDWELPYTMWEPYIREIQGKKKGESLDDSPTAMYGNFIRLVNILKR